jgi:hypothetical protein
MKTVLLAALFAALPVIAFSTAQAQDVRAACKADREKFCADLQPGEGKRHECMEQHAAELTPECKAAREVAKEAWKKIQAACKADAGKFCGDAGQERREIGKCLDAHASELDPVCAEALKSRPGANKA